MELTIYWSHFAEEKLKEIFEYYKINVNINVAENLVIGIVEAASEIKNHPFAGQKEDLLKDRIQEYRYIVFKSYKIIYWVDESNKMILISHVFDTRRNPEQLKILKK